MNIEHRFFPMTEVRVASADEKTTISGYAAVFNSLSDVLYWGFREKIAPGAFASSLENGYDIRALWNHDPTFPLGRTKNNTLRLQEDEKGLATEINPPASGYANDFVEAIRQGLVDQMSFGFQTLEDTWDILDDGTYVRTLMKVRLYEVSPVTFPAYPETSIGMRGGAEAVYVPPKPEIRRASSEPVLDEDQVRAHLERERRLRLAAV